MNPIEKENFILKVIDIVGRKQKDEKFCFIYLDADNVLTLLHPSGNTAIFYSYEDLAGLIEKDFERSE